MIKVNRVNASLRGKVQELAAAESRMAGLDKEIADLRAAPAPAPTSSTGTAAPDQNTIDEAIKSAVAARETELATLHAKALEEAQAGTKVETIVPAETTGADLDARIAEAVAARSAELEKERNALKGNVEELQQKVKTFERQIRTAEISRKTLERQKAEAEMRVKKLEGGEVGVVSTDEPASVITPQVVPPAGPSATTSSAPPVPASVAVPTTATPTRGTPRGRGRGVVRGTRGGAAGSRPNPVLSGAHPPDSPHHR